LTRCEGAQRETDDARHGRGARHEARDGSGATVRGARYRGAGRKVGDAGACGARQVWCDCARCEFFFFRKVRGARYGGTWREAGGVGKRGARRVRPIRTDGRRDRSITV
jgi:hypothetical protein